MIQYFSHIREGLSHFAEAEYQIVAPDFIAPESKARKVPDFTLVDRSSRPVKLSQFDSLDVLVVNVWSSGCPVCRQEIPSLTELDRRLSSLDDVALVTIAIAEDWEEVSSYFPKGTNLRILFDKDDSVGNGVFHTEKYPETFILDKQRRIRARFDGPRNWHGDTFINYVQSFL
ncbi:MAG: TlpA family protein disulfide reductase [Deltaproteobacteria bacterium]|nr:TlpA family protein disulfide reductase [Deltaproteobacteria bacterium]MBN2671907.1 TlpA family protein disulfide reductase [Deltaproteobacteria bacterium]